MRYDMNSIVGTRRPTQDDTSVFLASDDPVGLSMREILIYNVHVDLICYVIAEREGYYDECAENALLDPRSVDGYSPLIYTDAGYTLNKTDEMLYRLLYTN